MPAALAVWRQVLQGVVFAWMVQARADGFGGAAGGLLAHPWSVGIGRISYGVYLIHAFAPVVVHGLARALGAERRADASATAGRAVRRHGGGAGRLMWRSVERPLLTLKARVPYRPAEGR